MEFKFCTFLLQILFIFEIFSSILALDLKNLNHLESNCTQLTSKEKEFLGKSFLPHYIRKQFLEKNFENLHKNIGPECLEHLGLWKTELGKFLADPIFGGAETWALHMVDSWGKIPEGILSGHVSSPGDFDECVQIRETGQNFVGKYCTTTLAPNIILPKIPANISPNFQRTAVSFPELLEYMADFEHGFLMIPNLGVCVPSSCSPMEIDALISQLFLGIVMPTTNPCVTGDKKELTNGAIAFITFMSIILGLCLFGTLLDLYKRYQKKKLAYLNQENPNETQTILIKCFLAFSIYTNTLKLINTKSDPDNLGCINGIRFFTWVWVVVGHGFSLLRRLITTWNMVDLKRLHTNHWLMNIVLHSTLSVDTFFTLSGLLVAYNLLKVFDRKKDGKLSFLFLPLFYLHRYLRLTPIFAFMTYFQATMYPYLVTGPKEYMFDYLADLCQNYGWHNLVYLNNFITPNMEMCVDVAWYLANDMQLFFISPFLIYPLWKWEKFGLTFLGMVTISSVVIPAIIMDVWNLMPTVLINQNPLEALEYSVKIYMKPYARMGPYIVGIWTGYLIFKAKKSDKIKFSKIPWYIATIGWILSTGTALALLFGTWAWNSPTYEIKKAEGIIYGSLHRTLWGVCVSWVIYACIKGSGGFVNKFLSWKAFIPLGRLTFSAYLVSTTIQMIFVIYNTRQALMYNVWDMSAQICGDVVLSLGAGYLVNMLIETPFLLLEKILLGKFN